MPGPAHGIIMTNNEELFKIIDKEINPKYLRNIQTHQVISLLCTLIEMKYHGVEYQTNTIRMANALGKELELLGLKVVNQNGVYTQTHQLFLEMSKEKMETMFNNAIAEHITLNTKKKPLFHTGYGIRLGLQEISRYNWNDDTLHNIAEIIFEISKEKYSKEKITNLMNKLPEKKICFTFDSNYWKEILCLA
jgi:glycine hydroxymethyltransferase